MKYQDVQIFLFYLNTTKTSSACLFTKIQIMRNNPTILEDMPGLKIGGKIINNLRYADGTALIAENQKGLQNLLNVLTRH